MNSLIFEKEASIEGLEERSQGLVNDNDLLSERLRALELKLSEVSSTCEKHEQSLRETIEELEGRLEVSISREIAAKDQGTVLLTEMKSRDAKIQKYEAELAAGRSRIAELESSLRSAVSAQANNANDTDAVRADLIEMKVHYCLR